jgi:hypothetical protein
MAEAMPLSGSVALQGFFIVLKASFVTGVSAGWMQNLAVGYREG